MDPFESIFDLILIGIIIETSRVENKFNRLSSSKKQVYMWKQEESDKTALMKDKAAENTGKKKEEFGYGVESTVSHRVM